MKTFSYQVTDAAGMHARPAGLFVKLAATFTGSVSVAKGDKKADGKRLFAVMGLAAKQGETVTFTVEGPDEDAEIAKVEAFCAESL